MTLGILFRTEFAFEEAARTRSGLPRIQEGCKFRAGVFRGALLEDLGMGLKDGEVRVALDRAVLRVGKGFQSVPKVRMSAMLTGVLIPALSVGVSLGGARFHQFDESVHHVVVGTLAPISSGAGPDVEPTAVESRQ